MGSKFGTCWSFLGSFFGPLFGHFLDHFWGPFWGPFSDQISQRGSKMSPRGPSRASKTNKATFSKKWFSRWTVCIFSLLRPPKRASRGPRRLPRGTQRTPKPQKKGSKIDPKVNKFWTNFGSQNGFKNGPQNCSKERKINQDFSWMSKSLKGSTSFFWCPSTPL